MDKIELIKKLTDLHPGTIPEKYKHYGWYAGGMRDTGEWYFKVLLEEPIESLQECLDLMTPKMDTKPKEYSGEVVQLDNGNWYYVEEDKKHREFMKQREKEYWKFLGW